MDEYDSPQKLPLWGSLLMAGAWVAIIVGAAALLVEPAPDSAVASRSEDAARSDSSAARDAPDEPQEAVELAVEKAVNTA